MSWSAYEIRKDWKVWSVCVCVYRYVYIYTHTHTHIYIYIYTSTHFNSLYSYVGNTQLVKHINLIYNKFTPKIRTHLIIFKTEAGLISAILSFGAADFITFSLFGFHKLITTWYFGGLMYRIWPSYIQVCKLHWRSFNLIVLNIMVSS